MVRQPVRTTHTIIMHGAAHAMDCGLHGVTVGNQPSVVAVSNGIDTVRSNQ